MELDPRCIARSRVLGEPRVGGVDDAGEVVAGAVPATAFGLGIVSAFFDNIPLTKLALEQDHYDWDLLAFCVGYGGSMLWFGSSAGIAIAGLFPQAKSTRVWLANGWHVAVGYVLGFLAMMVLTGWNASPIPRSGGNDEPARMGAPTGAPSGR